MKPDDQMHPLLQQALDIITIERNAADYTRAFAAVRDVISVFGERDLANRLFEEIPRTVPEALVAELFDLLAWQTDDNGAAMMREVEAWLREGQDIRKLTVAMALEVYPFPDAQEMYQVMTTLAQAAPEVAARCQTLIMSRKANES
ncbi:hypothetical protein [Pseudomonas putida]